MHDHQSNQSSSIAPILGFNASNHFLDLAIVDKAGRKPRQFWNYTPSPASANLIAVDRCKPKMANGIGKLRELAHFRTGPKASRHTPTKIVQYKRGRNQDFLSAQ
jgi:hypothetical protein